MREKRKEARQRRAVEREEARAGRTDMQQIRRIEARGGESKKETARLMDRMTHP